MSQQSSQFALFRSLYSGSDGNLYRLEITLPSGIVAYLFEFGISCKKYTNAMHAIGEQCDALAAFITHIHDDHLKIGAFHKWALTQRVPPQLFLHERILDVPSWSHQQRDKKRRRLLEIEQSGAAIVHFPKTGNIYNDSTIEVESIPLQHYRDGVSYDSHDAPSVGYIVKVLLSGQPVVRFALLTDLGTFTERLWNRVRGVDFLFLDSSYDIDLLNAMPRQETKHLAYQRRMISGCGHLSNQQVSRVLRRTISAEGWPLKLFGAIHLSHKANDAETALQVLSRALSVQDCFASPVLTRARKWHGTVLFRIDESGTLIESSPWLDYEGNVVVIEKKKTKKTAECF